MSGFSHVTGEAARITAAFGLSFRAAASIARMLRSFRRVALVDEDQIGHPEVRLARAVARLMPGAVRVGDADVESRPVERQVVVSAVPEDDLRLGFRHLENPRVIDAGVDHEAAVDERLVLFPLLDRAAVSGEVVIGGESLLACRARSPYGIG